MTISRRDILGHLAGAGGAMGLAACSQDRKPVQSAERTTPVTAERSSVILPETPGTLLNRERASAVMRDAAVDAIICAVPRNVYYATNYFPQLGKMGMGGYAFAILPSDLGEAPVLVEGQFAFYLAAAEALAEGVDARLFTAPSAPDRFATALLEQIDAPASPGFFPRVHNIHDPDPIEIRKRVRTENLSSELSTNSHVALVKALREMRLTHKSLATDDAFTKLILTTADITNIDLRGENLLRQIRLQKSPAEVELMRFSARSNAEASLAAARAVRQGATLQEMRQNYHVQCGKRMMVPDFMVIDGIIPDLAREEIKEGRSFLIDCVSQFQEYHGDYGRTVCVGEPTREMRQATDAIGQVWDDLLPRLKPGVSYAQIGEWAQASFARTESVATLICNPHSVGLQHTDEPSATEDGYFVKDNHTLVENMILSVDLPMVDVGLGGSAHLEDLVLITPQGAELLNDAGDRVIVV